MRMRQTRKDVQLEAAEQNKNIIPKVSKYGRKEERKEQPPPQPLQNLASTLTLALNPTHSLCTTPNEQATAVPFYTASLSSSPPPPLTKLIIAPDITLLNPVPIVPLYTDSSSLFPIHRPPSLSTLSTPLLFNPLLQSPIHCPFP